MQNISSKKRYPIFMEILPKNPIKIHGKREASKEASATTLQFDIVRDCDQKMMRTSTVRDRSVAALDENLNHRMEIIAVLHV